MMSLPPEHRPIPARERARASLRKILGAPIRGGLHRFDRSLPGYHLPDAARALRDFLPSRELVAELVGAILPGRGSRHDGPWSALDEVLAPSGHSRIGAVHHRSLAVGPDRYEKLPVGNLTVVRGGPVPLALVPVPPSYPGAPVSLMGAIVAQDAAIAWADHLLDSLESWIRENSCYRRQMLRPRFLDTDDEVEIEILPAPSAEDVRLPEALSDELEETFVTYARHRALLEGREIETRRGLLLCGAPGTGKTSTCRYLKARMPDHTFIVVAPATYAYLKGVFALARRFAPAVIVIEDVDLIAHAREADHGSWPLVELMNQLDGLTPREDVSIILTSNVWEFLEKALACRPGRVDHVVFFREPTADLRRELLRYFLRGLSLEGDLDRLVEQTRSLSPAQLKEVVKRAAVASLRREGEARWSARVVDADIARALHGIASNGRIGGKRPIGLVGRPAAVRREGDIEWP